MTMDGGVPGIHQHFGTDGHPVDSVRHRLGSHWTHALTERTDEGPANHPPDAAQHIAWAEVEGKRPRHSPHSDMPAEAQYSDDPQDGQWCRP